MTGILMAAGAVLGLGAGSFLTVVADCVSRGRPVVWPRRACPDCGHRTRARDRLPVLSWIMLRGRCRNCGARIPVRYPLAEAGTAAAFAGLALALGPSWALPAYWWIGGTAIALTLVDLDVHRIPNRMLFPATAGAVALLLAGAIGDADLGAFLRCLAGGAAYFAVLLAAALGSRGGIGFGDVKFGFLLGLALAYRSWRVLVVGGLAGILLGGLAAAALLILRRVRRKDKIPFGPSMVAGAAVALACGEALARWYLG